jgi:hypothetical protein
MKKILVRTLNQNMVNGVNIYLERNKFKETCRNRFEELASTCAEHFVRYVHKKKSWQMKLRN